MISRTTVYAAAAKIQAALGTAAVPTFAQNAIRLIGKNQLAFNFLDNGDRKDEQHAGMGVIGQGPKTGSWAQVDITGPIMGGLSDYFGGAARPWWDPFMRGAGLSATESGGAGTGVVTYTTLDDGAFEVFTLLLQSATELYTLVDCIALPKLSAEAAKRGTFTFTVIGRVSSVAESTFAGQTLNEAAAPSFVGQQVAIGALNSASAPYPLVTRKIDLDFGTAHTPRAAAGATDGYLGDVITDRALNLSMEIEKLPRTTWDPYAIAKESMPGGTDRKVSFQLGGAQFNRVKFALGQFLFAAPTLQDASGLATWPLKGDIQARSLAGGREITITVD